MSKLSLEVVEGADAGRRVLVASPLYIGRGSDVDFRLDDSRVSRQHVRVAPADGALSVEDLDSRNGTEINGADVLPHVLARLEPGDELRLGTTVLELRSPAQIEARPSAVRPVPPPLRTPVRQPDYVPPAAGAAEDDKAIREVDKYLDKVTKAKARTAPIALFALVALAVVVYLAAK